MVCEVCGKSYIATRKGSHYCSDRCRAHASNVRKTKDSSRPRRVYVPTGRSVGRPRKDPAPAPIPVQEKTRSKHESEFVEKVKKSMDLLPDDKENYGPGKQGRITSGFFSGCTWDEMEDIRKFQETGKIGG
ncbi:hypothetical protein ES703_62323 [subsurface metagenome]